MKKVLFLLCWLVNCSFAAEDYYAFSNPSHQQRFTELTSQLRCLVCQNQNIAESNASLAADLREQVYQQIEQGRSDKAIVDYLVARYGNFILYQPPLNHQTIALWFAPLVLLIVGIGYLLYYIRREKKNDNVI